MRGLPVSVYIASRLYATKPLQHNCVLFPSSYSRMQRFTVYTHKFYWQLLLHDHSWGKHWVSRPRFYTPSKTGDV
jgi:hypothetical protein